MALRRYRKHPKWAFRDRSTSALEPVYSVHYNDYAAQLQGAQIAYDVGIQRTCWQIHSLTNWMGDAGFVKSIHGQYRSHVYLSDVVRLGGRVVAKEIDDDGDHVVRLETWASNQRGQNVMPGSAVVAPADRAASVEPVSTRQPRRGATRSRSIEVARRPVPHVHRSARTHIREPAGVRRPLGRPSAHRPGRHAS